ncbi:unnamed protein product, partial [Urochloa humidicola]
FLSLFPLHTFLPVRPSLPVNHACTTSILHLSLPFPSLPRPSLYKIPPFPSAGGGKAGAVVLVDESGGRHEHGDNVEMRVAASTSMGTRCGDAGGGDRRRSVQVLGRRASAGWCQDAAARVGANHAAGERGIQADD